MRLHLLYIFSIISFSWAYYGPTDKFNGINLGINQIAFQIDRTIYSYAGIQENSIKFQDNITMQMIDDNKNLQVSQKPIQPGGFGCLSCNGFVLNDSAILIYVGYSEIDSASANASNKNNMGFLYYNPPTYTFTRPDGFKDLANSPLQRQYQSTVITPDNSSVYIFGGMGAFPNSSTDMPIVRFDMAISTYTTYQNFQMLGGTATMLP
jgi:hypothetical protein